MTLLEENPNTPPRRWTEPGVLYIIATPIGNRADLSERARLVLCAVDCLAAEDTRHVKRLTQNLPVRGDLISLHQHNENAATEKILARLHQGQSVGLVSDAGTPLISDPGYGLVAAVRGAGFTVSPIAGPSAVIAALSASGLPAQPFWFEGFLPAKASAREQRLQQLAALQATLVFYEAPHRIEATLQSVATVIGGAHPAALARELTKRHEQIVNAPVAALQAMLQQGEIPVRGEMVLLLGPAGSSREDEQDKALTQQLIQTMQISPRARWWM